ncbi:MAG: zinc-binding dehydrogenase, partial [Bacteroidota bacterium]
VQVLTAYYALRPLGDLQQGQTVLVHSAAGGVGLWANRIAQKWGAFTIGSVGRAEKLPLLEKEGYNRGIVRGKDFAEKLDQALDGRELDIVLECIGGKILRQSFEAMAPMGRLIAYGSAQYASRGKRPNYLKLLYYYLQRPKLDIQNTINLNKS